MLENPNSRGKRVCLRHHHTSPSVTRRSSLSRMVSPCSTTSNIKTTHHESPATTTKTRTSTTGSATATRVLGRTNSHLISAKLNPYVGWFRHSPPSYLSSSNVWYYCHPKNLPVSSISLKDSLLRTTDCHRTILAHRSIPQRDADGVLLNLAELWSKQLLGGAPGGMHFPTGTREKSSVLSTLSRTILHGVTDWLTESLQFDDPDFTSSTQAGGNDIHNKKKRKSFRDESRLHNRRLSEGLRIYDSSSEDDESDEEGESDDSSCDTIPVHRRPPLPPELAHMCLSESSLAPGARVSSQAEAYCAHMLMMNSALRQDSSRLLVRSPSHGDMRWGGGRLDYDITQMDVMRMTRNASRHLDVESILKLPVMTYQEGEEEEVKKESSPAGCPTLDVLQNHPVTEPEGSWSWMLVPGNDENVNSIEASSHKMSPTIQESNDEGQICAGDEVAEEKDVCVICLEHFVKGDRLRLLPCKHRFHMGCIDQWLSGSHSFDECFTAGCPTCKKRPDQAKSYNDGSVPSWAFAHIGMILHRGDSMGSQCM